MPGWMFRRKLRIGKRLYTLKNNDQFGDKMRYYYDSYSKGLTYRQNMDDMWLMNQCGYEYRFDESSGNLLIRHLKTNVDHIAITPDGKIAVKAHRDSWGRISWEFSNFIQGFFRTVFGYNVRFITRYKKDRLYVYPESEDWIDWDSDIRVKKFVITSDEKMVILDAGMNILYGAIPQKNSSNKRNSPDERNQTRGKRETDW
jgi:hypothetical protein